MKAETVAAIRPLLALSEAITPEPEDQFDVATPSFS